MNLIDPRIRFLCALAVAAAALGLASGCNRAPAPPPASAGATVPPLGAGGTEGPATATPDGSVERTITVEGRLVQPLEPQPLSFGAAGTVTEIRVEAGQPVEAGDVLARMDSGPFDLAVADARAAVAQARASLTRLETGTALETARLDVERAKNQLWGTQSQRDAICGAYERGQKEGGFAKVAAPSSADCNGAQASVQAGEQAVLMAEAQVRAAEASAGTDLASAGATLERARLALAQALDNRARAELVAPFAGTVSVVHLLPGLAAAPGVPVVTVAPGGPLQFVTDNLSERDVAAVEVGLPATITLIAFPDEGLEALVGRLADRGAVSADGVVVFTAHLYLAADGGLPLRAGMTGRAEIRTSGRP